MKAETNNVNSPEGITLVLGGTGKTGHRVVERLQARFVSKGRQALWILSGKRYSVKDCSVVMLSQTCSATAGMPGVRCVKITRDLPGCYGNIRLMVKTWTILTQLIYIA